MDKVAYNANEAYNIYNNYALWTGFSMWKGKPGYFNGTKNIRQHEFLCFTKGFKMKILVKRKIGRMEVRTCCKAFIYSTVENDVLKVTTFNLEHIYKLALLSKIHLLRSSRRISKPKVGLIDSIVNVGISTKNTYLYLIEEVGGSEDVGFTKKDCYNHIKKKSCEHKKDVKDKC